VREGVAESVGVAVLLAVGAGESVAVAEGAGVALWVGRAVVGKRVASAALQAARNIPAINSPNTHLCIKIKTSPIRSARWEMF
jgi:hypothetical protein